MALWVLMHIHAIVVWGYPDRVCSRFCSKFSGGVCSNFSGGAPDFALNFSGGAPDFALNFWGVCSNFSGGQILL